MSTQKILLLVEGEKGEPELLSHFYRLYNVENVHIISYKTNLYAFYHRLKKEYSDPSGRIEYEYIDLPLFLNDYFDLIGDDRLNKNDFQDILLVFDYDPQDTSYSHDKLLELVSNFTDSTDLGKLYINYPMLESYKDISNLNDESFMSTIVQFQDLQKTGSGKSRYKRLVSSRSSVSDVEKISKDEGNQIINLHNRKLKLLTAGETDMVSKYIRVCKVQCEKLNRDNQIWVLNTALIHFRDEYGEIGI